MYGLICPNCGSQVDFPQTNCRSCHHFVGYPNVRRAEAMHAPLNQHYVAAKADADIRGVTVRVGQLEALLEHSVVTINTSAKVLASMALDHPYRSYYRAYDEGLRSIAEAKYHGDRAAVDAKVHTGYERHILNAALSPDGSGLINYGEITLQLREISVRDRASVLRENAFDFYERYGLGGRSSEEESGWRSTWPERARLGVAHLAPGITPAISLAGLPALVLTVGVARSDDRYMEVHIYGELNKEALEKVTLAKPLTEPEERDNWDFARQKLSLIGVGVVGGSGP